MTIADLLADFDTEISDTRRTLERVPKSQNDWTTTAFRATASDLRPML